ncbi:MAG: ISKra4 family transposase, partial [Thermogemmata sp.]|nr:ISKra4 family transposase [Thermogemmata sp.]
MVSALGEVRLERAYYYCRHCGHGHCPWEAELGLTRQDLTPAASELTSLAGLLCSFDEASQKVLPKLAGLRLSESTVERTTEAAGARVGEALASGATFGPCTPWKWRLDAMGRRCAYVSVDATGVGQQGPHGEKADGRMAIVGMIFNANERGPCQARYLAGLYTLEELGPPLRRQASQVGVQEAEVWIALTDGGAGLEEFMRINFPQAVCILDFFHAAQHVRELAKAWHANDEEQARALGQQWCHTLKHEGGQALLRLLEALDLRGRSLVARETHRQVVQY